MFYLQDAFIYLHNEGQCYTNPYGGLF